MTYRKIDTSRERAIKKIKDITQQKKLANAEQQENAKRNFSKKQNESLKYFRDIDRKINSKMQSAEKRSQSLLSNSVRLNSAKSKEQHSRDVKENRFYIQWAEVSLSQALRTK